MKPAADSLGYHLDPKLVKKAEFWWRNICPEAMKSECSMWTILAAFADWLQRFPE